MDFKFNFNSAIDVYVIMAETLEHLLTDDYQGPQTIFVDRNQVWFNAVQLSDRQDIGMYDTVLPPMWRRIYAALMKSEALQIPVYADEWFNQRLGTISVDAFVNACVTCADQNPILWERLIIGSGKKGDYCQFCLNFVLVK
jgi:hypothetical protein